MVRARSVMAVASLVYLPWAAGILVQAAGSQPNFVVIMADDQDDVLGSLEAQPVVRRELMDKGITLNNHFVTVAQCCPSRTSYLRGQHAHNTNLTHVAPPGGAWDKFLASGFDEDNLPHWLQAAGYKTEYIGKLMNGINMATYSPMPKGWDHTDLLVKPYVYDYNHVVMSMNGERPVYYDGYHQTDVIRAKAVARLQELGKGDAPFYIQIAPVAPHTANDGSAIPCARHMWSFNDATAPRTPNFNPNDEFTAQKPSWLKELPSMTDEVINFVDWTYRQRLQSLLGVDEMVEDILATLEEQGQLDNTYIIYTSDNGYHLGNHRQLGGKGLPYLEDTKVPMIIRGPGIPANSSSDFPSTHIDMAPTYLELAGVTKSDWPVFLDGRSLAGELEHPTSGHDSGCSLRPRGREVLNVEFWGTIANGAGPDYGRRSPVYSYKTVRVITEEYSWLFSRWCGRNETELYDTKADRYELTNLAMNPTPEHERLIQRLNGLLLVTKSCSEASCRNAWQVLREAADGDFNDLEEAMASEYDEFFASLPGVGYAECLDWQETSNEGSYYPAEAISLGSDHRQETGHFVIQEVKDYKRVSGSDSRHGGTRQRTATLDDMLKMARDLTDAEMGTRTSCGPPYACGGPE